VLYRKFAEIFFDMIKKILLILLVLIIAIAGYVWYKFSTDKGSGFEGEHAKKLEIKSATPAFDGGIKAMLTAYFHMKDAFVEADTATAKSSCKAMVQIIDGINLDELKKDTSGLITTIEPLLNDVKSNAISVLAQSELNEMRMDFNQVNQQLYSLLKAINYKGEKIYWQNCPMAFGENREGSWISNTEEIVNPYLGKNHPEYKATMLHCGSVKDTIKAQ
jgi:hypothetical protein